MQLPTTTVPLSGKVYKRRPDCRLCGSRDLSLAITLTPTPPANAFVTEAQKGVKQFSIPLEVFFCDDCFHLQLLDVVDPDLLFANYVYVSGTSPVFRTHFKDYAQSILDRCDLKPESLVVEIGSNDGTLLREFKGVGLRVLGIDPARDIAHNATSQGVPTLPVFFGNDTAKKIVADHGQASLVLANNVMAHIDDLSDVMKGVKKLLTPQGLLVFEVSYLLDVYENILFDTIYHEHLDYHSVLSLRPFLEKHDFTLIDVVHVTSHGGSIRCIVQHKGGPYDIEPSVQAMVTKEKSAGLNNLVTYGKFAQKIDDLGRSLATLLADLKSKGKTIAGFGAPAKATTLMYHFGIDRHLIDFIVDDSPLKQGLYSPGMHIPVLPSNAIKEQMPDYLLVLAWNFAPAIVAKNSEFLARGGKFIVPIPKLEVISS